ncbi:hypothetical protein M501DRAFT_990497 [Patellaria atrata CBS 101060]|uniref:Myb-like domain-containing protein n=1 Tax=Patellaria atrata CBS 101060 TaxID=1346257 RepID=A0A9P4S2W5_9PEZI|nr:hypothetical protein M501DRAFT_990497 [Patellaria atrata CBS 101060]
MAKLANPSPASLIPFVSPSGYPSSRLQDRSINYSLSIANSDGDTTCASYNIANQLHAHTPSAVSPNGPGNEVIHYCRFTVPKETEVTVTIVRCPHGSAFLTEGVTDAQRHNVTKISPDRYLWIQARATCGEKPLSRRRGRPRRRIRELWTEQEIECMKKIKNNVTEGNGMDWDSICKKFPGRTGPAVKTRYLLNAMLLNLANEKGS